MTIAIGTLLTTDALGMAVAVTHARIHRPAAATTSPASGLRAVASAAVLYMRLGINCDTEVGVNLR